MSEIPSLMVLVPVLGRPHRVEPLVASLITSLDGENVHAKILFLATPGDDRELAAIRRLDLTVELALVDGERSQYPRKINHGAKITESDWLLMGADDLQFQPGWWREALNVHIKTGALVVGTQDQGNQLVKRGLHSTHSLVHRSYVGQGTIDGSGLLLHEGYDHNSTDVEFWETALYKGVAAFADLAVIRHDHPLWSRQAGRSRVARDATYNKGFQNARFDRALLNARRPLWQGRVDPGVRKADPRPRIVRARVPYGRPR